MPIARIRRLAMLTNYLRVQAILEAEAAAMAEDYPNFRDAPGDLDGALAQAEYARLAIAKAIEMIDPA